MGNVDVSCVCVVVGGGEATHSLAVRVAGVAATVKLCMCDCGVCDLDMLRAEAAFSKPG